MQPSQPTQDPPPPQKINLFLAIISAGAGICGLWLLTRNVTAGLIIIVLSLFYFYSIYRSRTSPTPRLWHGIGVAIGSIFMVGGFMVAGLFLLFMIALFMFAGVNLGGGVGGGSGK